MSMRLDALRPHLQMPTTEFDIALSTFGKIRAAFPALTMNLDLHPKNVDLEMDIPAQAELLFRVNLNLQGDELHLSASRFWVEWFPCTKPEKVDRYFEAVSGYCLENFVSLNTGEGGVRSRHSYNVPSVVHGRASQHGVTCQ